MDTRNKRRTLVKNNGDVHRHMRWKHIYETLVDVLVDDCITLIETYDATQVIDMKVQRYGKQAWLRRYYVDTNELVWICSFSSSQDRHPKMFIVKNRIWTMSDIIDHSNNNPFESSQRQLLDVSYQFELSSYQKRKYESYQRIQAMSHDLYCVTSKHMYYLTYVDDVTRNIWIQEITGETDARCLPFQFISMEPYCLKISSFNDRVFIFCVDTFAEVLSNKLDRLPFFTTAIRYNDLSWGIEWCQYDDEQILVLISKSGDTCLFHMHTRQWTNLMNPSNDNDDGSKGKQMIKPDCIYYEVVNVNHNIYAIHRKTSCRKCVDVLILNPKTLTWNVLNSPSLPWWSAMCVYIPKLD